MQRLLRARDGKQPQAQCVEHPHRIAQALDRFGPDEGHKAGEHCRCEIAPVLECGRGYRADQQVAEDAACAGGCERQHQHAEQVQALAHGGRRARERENKHADEIDDQQHPRIVHHRGRCSTFATQ